MNFLQKRRHFHFVQKEPLPFHQNVTALFTLIFLRKHDYLAIIIQCNYSSETLPKRHYRYCFFTRPFCLFYRNIIILSAKGLFPQKCYFFFTKDFIITIFRYSGIILIFTRDSNIISAPALSSFHRVKCPIFHKEKLFIRFRSKRLNSIERHLFQNDIEGQQWTNGNGKGGGVDCTCTYPFSIHVEVVRDTHCSNLRKKTQKNIFQINSLVVLPPKGKYFFKKSINLNAIASKWTT